MDTYEEEHNEDDATTPLDEEIEAEISLHAMAGTPTPQTMRVTGMIASHPFYILIDSGSTHNFIDPHIFHQTGLISNSDSRVKVQVANGDQMQSEGKCSDVAFTIQGVPLSCDFHILALGGYDGVLGIHWLQTLGPVRMDFTNLWMEFTINGKLHRLKGIQPQSTHIASCNSILKAHRDNDNCYYLYSLKSDAVVVSTDTLNLDPQVSQLLSQYKDVFALPTGLPPHRQLDHHILTNDGSPPVNSAPTDTRSIKKMRLRRL